MVTLFHHLSVCFFCTFMFALSWFIFPLLCACFCMLIDPVSHAFLYASLFAFVYFLCAFLFAFPTFAFLCAFLCAFFLCFYVCFVLTKIKLHSFLVADTQLYKRLCPSVGPSVSPSVRNHRVKKWENAHFRPCPPVRNWWPCIRPCFLFTLFKWTHIQNVFCV